MQLLVDTTLFFSVIDLVMTNAIILIKLRERIKNVCHGIATGEIFCHKLERLQIYQYDFFVTINKYLENAIVSHVKYMPL